MKNLASKFEKILSIPQVATSDEVDFCAAPEEDVSAILLPTPAGPQASSQSASGSVPPPPAPPPATFTRSSSIRSTSSTGSTGSADGLRRPLRPPDYETALQRRELMKKQRASISSSIDEEFSNLPPPANDILATPPLARAHLQSTSSIGSITSLKDCSDSALSVKCRKDTPLAREQSPTAACKTRTVSTSSTGSSSKTKSVTFSDQVELVSCAEEVVDDFVPNPLLERVLKQHKERVQDQLNSSIESSAEVAGGVEAASTTETSSEMCNLCHVQAVPSDVTYCSDCSFYMSRFQKPTES